MLGDKKQDQMKDYEFHNIAEVCERCEMSEKNVYDLMDEGEFPRYFISTDKQVLWFQRDINKYLVKKLTKSFLLFSRSSHIDKGVHY